MQKLKWGIPNDDSHYLLMNWNCELEFHNQNWNCIRRWGEWNLFSATGKTKQNEWNLIFERKRHFSPRSLSVSLYRSLAMQLSENVLVPLDGNVLTSQAFREHVAGHRAAESVRPKPKITFQVIDLNVSRVQFTVCLLHRAPLARNRPTVNQRNGSE